MQEAKSLNSSLFTLYPFLLTILYSPNFAKHIFRCNFAHEKSSVWQTATTLTY